MKQQLLQAQLDEIETICKAQVKVHADGYRRQAVTLAKQLLKTFEKDYVSKQIASTKQ